MTGGPDGSSAYTLTAKTNITTDNVNVSGGSLKAEGTITANNNVNVSGGLLLAEQTTGAVNVNVSGGTYTAKGDVTATGAVERLRRNHERRNERKCGPT